MAYPVSVEHSPSLVIHQRLISEATPLFFFFCQTTQLQALLWQCGIISAVQQTVSGVQRVSLSSQVTFHVRVVKNRFTYKKHLDHYISCQYKRQLKWWVLFIIMLNKTNTAFHRYRGWFMVYSALQPFPSSFSLSVLSARRHKSPTQILPTIFSTNTASFLRTVLGGTSDWIYARKGSKTTTMCTGKCSRFIALTLYPLALLSIALNIGLFFPGGDTQYLKDSRITEEVKYMGGVIGGGIMVSENV